MDGARGHGGGRPAGDPGLARALEELAFFTTDVKVLGVYPAARERGE